MRTKQRTVISAGTDVMDSVEHLVLTGRYRTVPEFVGQALVEKL